MPYRPRPTRELERVAPAACAARPQPAPAMDAALAQIGAAFDEAAAVNAFKLRVERHLRLGPRHPAVRARFGARAAMLSGRSLDARDRCLPSAGGATERKAFQIASALGYGNRLSLDVLCELRLILRLMRFKRNARRSFGAIVAAVCDASMTTMAAE